MKSLKLFLEGRNDPSIFHAVFMAGAPGAGKSYVSDWMSLGPQLGYKVINSDMEFTRYMKDAGLTDDKGAVILEPATAYAKDVIRTVAKRHTKSKQVHAVIGRLGLVIDGTGANAKKVLKQKRTLEALGYECAMVYVTIPLEASIASDKKRGEDGERTIGPELVTQKFKELDKSLPKLKRSFGKLFFEIDNSVREKTPAIIRGVLNTITKWSKQMPKNGWAKEWLKHN